MLVAEMKKEIHAVTGAFGYSGKYIAERLLAQGKSVITLTNSLNRIINVHYRVSERNLQQADR